MKTQPDVDVSAMQIFSGKHFKSWARTLTFAVGDVNADWRNRNATRRAALHIFGRVKYESEHALVIVDFLAKSIKLVNCNRKDLKFEKIPGSFFPT